MHLNNAPQVVAPSGLNDGRNSDLKSMSIPELKQFANEKYWADEYVSAQAAIEEILGRSKCSLKHLDHECLELFMNVAVCQMQQSKPEQALTILNRLLVFSRLEKIDNNNGMDEPDCLFFQAECRYRTGDYKQAERLYKEALDLYRKRLPPLSADLSPALDGLAGCLYRRNDFQGALPLFVELARIDIQNRGPDDLATAWSLLNLSDVMKRVGRAEQAAALFDKAVFIFRQTNAEQILAQYKSSSESGVLQAVEKAPEEDVKAKLRQLVFGAADRSDFASGGKAFAELSRGIDYSNKPPQRPSDFYNWRLKRTKVTDAPGLVTMNPNKPLKGLIICVHGLGLHHGTYRQFAQKMADLGFLVVAFDVRGFGSFRENKGYDRIDLDNCVDDLSGIVKLMRRDYPDKSIFLLGESMGGAIALHVAAAVAPLLDGLICSVPSGSRFGAAKTNVKVAVRLLSHRNKPFDIGKQIVKQATKEENLRQQWKTDPEARLSLSALELVHFQKFMNQNLKAAEKLKNLPVVIFQGYGDKLVKPEGTLALYNAISTEDKDLVFVGHSEHLIFEEGQFKPALINSLNGWLCSHLKEDAAR